MPRQPRLDAPGVLHHVMVRGLERRVIFRDDADRPDFCARVGRLVETTGLTAYDWALLPNHAHLLLRSGQRPLARCMCSLLTGHAGAFNRRHQRVGHLFPNRYKSIVAEEDPYMLELVRHLHLKPLRAQVVATLGALQAAEPLPGRRRPLASLVAKVCAATGCHSTALQQGSRRAPAARAREGLAYLALEVCRYPGPGVADLLGVRPSAVYRAAQRGRAARGAGSNCSQPRRPGRMFGSHVPRDV